MKVTVPSRPGGIELPDAQSARVARPRLSRDQQKFRRRQELLNAAWILFCEKGYEAVTIDDVADHAGCSRQPVYSFFGDKQNLFFELQREAITATVEMLQTFMPEGVALRDNLTRFAQFVSDQLNSNKPTYGERLFFVAHTISLSRPDIAERMKVEARRVLEALVGGIRRSVLARGDRLRGTPEQVAAHLVGLVNGMTTVQFQTEKRYTNAQDLAAIFMAITFTTD